MRTLAKVIKFLKEYRLLWICAVLFVFAFIFNHDFLNYFNLNGLFSEVSYIGVIALAEGIVIISSGIDLAVGNIASLTTVVISWAMVLFQGILPDGLNTLFSLLLAIVFSCVLGLITGVCVAYLRIPPIIASLGTMWIAKGIAFFLTSGVASGFEVGDFTIIGQIAVGPIALPLLIFVIITGLLYIMMTRTRTGNSIYARGGNEYAAYISGIKIKKYTIGVYILSAFLSSIAGILMASVTLTGYAKSGDGYELIAIAAVVMAGVPLSGGKGNIWNVMLGVFALRLFNKILIFTNLSGYLAGAYLGIILLVALWLNTRQSMNGKQIKPAKVK